MLTDLGTELFEQGLKSEVPTFLMNCHGLAVAGDEEGFSLVSFKIHTDADKVGSIIVKGEPAKWAKILASWGGVFHAKARIVPGKKYETGDGQSVIPLRGDIFKTMSELK